MSSFKINFNLKNRETLYTSIAVGLLTCSYFGYRVWNNRRKKSLQEEKSNLPIANVAILDLDVFDKGTKEERAKQCRLAAESLHSTGVLYVKDPRVHNVDNETFLDMMERYFEQSDGVTDSRKEYNYQVGVTPSGVEKARNHCQAIKNMSAENKPFTICPPEADPKWRFFWRIGPRPKNTKFDTLNMEDVIPAEFPEWKGTMDMWGNKMLAALMKVAEATAEGFGLPSNAFTSRMENGPHLLAPTGSNFNIYNKVNTYLAGYHYDLNFLTIHGKSRFPGLYIWLRDGTKAMVKVPEGCLLVQAGKQIEYLTGGHVLAGFHEVVIAPETLKVIEKRKKEGKSLWRISSTLFGHIQSDQVLEPLDHFKNDESVRKFPPIITGDQVLDELKAIKLGNGYELNGKAETKTSLEGM